MLVHRLPISQVVSTTCFFCFTSVYWLFSYHSNNALIFQAISLTYLQVTSYQLRLTLAERLICAEKSTSFTLTCSRLNSQFHNAASYYFHCSDKQNNHAMRKIIILLLLAIVGYIEIKKYPSLSTTKNYFRKSYRCKRTANG